jgi:hypothetical protein
MFKKTRTKTKTKQKMNPVIKTVRAHRQPDHAPLFFVVAVVVVSVPAGRNWITI